MKYRQLGRSGLRLSAVGLGSYLTIGFGLDDDSSKATIHRAIERGINWFDTANAYNKGQAEHVLGRYLKDFPRESIVIATKVYSPMGPGTNDRGLSAKHVFEQCHASLQRLSTDYVDLYQCHRPDPHAPLEETVRAMDDLGRQGKILYWGTSEWPAWLIQKAIGIAQQMRAKPPVSNQPRYSLLYRQPEMELFQFCDSEGIGNVTFSSLAHGILTGKYLPGTPPPPDTRAAKDDQNGVIKRMYWKDESLRKAQELKAIAGELKLTAAQLSLAWALRRPEVTSTIIGASRVSQIDENCAAAEATIGDDVWKRLDAIFPAPPETYPIK